MSYSWRFHNFLNLFCFYSYFPIFVSNAVYLCPVCFSCLNWPKISIFITLFKVIFCLCWSLLLFVCLFVFYFIQILLLSLSFPIFLVWFCLHPNWSFHPYIDIYILQIPQIQHLQMEFQLLTKHALLPPRFLSMVLHHHFTKQSPRNVFNSSFLHTSHILLCTISVCFPFEIFLKSGPIAIVLTQTIIIAFLVNDSQVS